MKRIILCYLISFIFLFAAHSLLPLSTFFKLCFSICFENKIIWFKYNFFLALLWSFFLFWEHVFFGFVCIIGAAIVFFFSGFFSGNLRIDWEHFITTHLQAHIIMGFKYTMGREREKEREKPTQPLEQFEWVVLHFLFASSDLNIADFMLMDGLTYFSVVFCFVAVVIVVTNIYFLH